MLNNFNTIGEAIAFTRELLKTYGESIVTESWQGIKHERRMFEYCNVYWGAQMPNDLKTLVRQVGPSLPWADLHFEERILGQPLNPGESYKTWPGYKDVKFNDENFRHIADDINKKQTKFSHTYMERYWPKYAGEAESERIKQNLSQSVIEEMFGVELGIRYHWGDLMDVVNLLKKEPYTRQAYLPVWFPEDTGVLHGGRVPCTLGYHFIMRNNRLNIHYTIRACDWLRHFRNDIYLTVRLAMWVLHQLQPKLNAGEVLYNNSWLEASLGIITFDCISLHVFDQEKNLI